MSVFVVIALVYYMAYNCVLNSFTDKTLDYMDFVESKTNRVLSEIFSWTVPIWLLHIPEVSARLVYQWWIRVPLLLVVFPPLFTTGVLLSLVSLPVVFFGRKVSDIIAAEPAIPQVVDYEELPLCS